MGAGSAQFSSRLAHRRRGLAVSSTVLAPCAAASSSVLEERLLLLTGMTLVEICGPGVVQQNGPDLVRGLHVGMARPATPRIKRTMAKISAASAAAARTIIPRAKGRRVFTGIMVPPRGCPARRGFEVIIACLRRAAQEDLPIFASGLAGMWYTERDTRATPAQFTPVGSVAHHANNFPCYFPNARQSTKDWLRFLVHITKNFLAHSTAWNCA